VPVERILRRVQTTAVAVCVAMAAGALVWSRGRASPALAVLGGGLLAGISYHMLASGVDDIVRALMPQGPTPPRATRRLRAAMVGKLVGRYALLAILAYVMIARLRLHPVGLLVGASSVVAAVALEAVRFLLKKTP
jgi:hypothetical protein